MKLSTVQQIFNNAFPFLKLAFIRNPKVSTNHYARFEPAKFSEIPEAQLVSHKITSLVINADMTVTTVEQLFLECFGLSTQLLRKYGKLWIETRLTDDWTLEKQNNEGEAISTYLS